MLKGKQISVSNASATRIDTNPRVPSDASIQVLIRNHGANSVFLGGSNAVTTSGGTAGYECKTTETVGPITLTGTDQLWGIAATAPVLLDVIEMGSNVRQR